MIFSLCSCSFEEVLVMTPSLCTCRLEEVLVMISLNPQVKRGVGYDLLSVPAG